MSTKIYYAWRIPKSRLNEFTDLVRQTTWEYLLERIDTWLENFVSDQDVQDYIDREYQRVVDSLDGKEPMWPVKKNEISDEMRWRCLEERIVRDSTHPERRLYDCDASFNFWLHGRYAYIIPYGKFKINAPFPEWIEDYSYWDNSDRPDSVSARAWTARGKMWNWVCLNDWNSNRYQHIIAEFDAVYSRSAWAVSFYLGLHGEEAMRDVEPWKL
jgi:hypothetical protein